MELQNGRFHILAGIRCPLVLSVGTDLLRVSRHWRFNSSAFDFRAHVIHVFSVHWKTRSRIMVGFALSETVRSPGPVSGGNG